MNIMFIDLEMNQPSGTIIQVGYCVGSSDSGQVLARGSWDIHTTEQISEYITQLTGITQERVLNGVPLQQAYTELCNIHKEHQCFRNLGQWGQGDSYALMQQLGLYGNTFLGGRRTIDVKTLYVAYRVFTVGKVVGGLANSLKKLGKPFEGVNHDAGDDAYNTFRMFMALKEKTIK